MSTILKKGDEINGTYKVQCFIGKGAFGEVYRVKHKFMGVQVLKVLLDDYIENTNLDEVSSESKILAGLTHQNIVRVFETNTFDLDGKSRFFMTMGFVSGESLAQLMKREISLPLSISLSIQTALLRGLSEVHSQEPPIIHRDISPDNVLLSYDNENPQALLSDFGLAQSIEQLDNIPNSAGKYLYFAPECFWGVYLPSSDVFSAGIVLYRMLTGAFPWNYDFDNLAAADKEGMTTMILKGQKIDPKPPSFYDENCTENLDRIVLKSISKEMSDRYVNASDFLAELEEEFESYTSSDSELNELIYY